MQTDRYASSARHRDSDSAWSRRVRHAIAVVAIGALLSACFAATAPSERVAPDPAHYVKRETWQQTMLASLGAIAEQSWPEGFADFESDTLRGGQPAQRVSLSVAGAKEMFLFVTGIPDVKWAVADWADAVLVGKDGKLTPLSSLRNIVAVHGRMEKDLTLRSGLYQKLRLGDREFERGLNVQANSVVRVPLDGRYVRFEAWIGVDAWARNNGSVRFSVTGSRTAARKRLFELVARDFAEGPARQQMSWEREDRIFETDWTPGVWSGLAARYARACQRVPPLMALAMADASGVQDEAALTKVRETYYRSRQLAAAVEQARSFDAEGLRLALENLERTFPEKYPAKHRVRLGELAAASRAALAQFDSARLTAFEAVAQLQADLESLKREALLANPLLDFERLLVVKRKPLGDPRRSQWEGYGLGEYLGVPRQSSWNHGTMTNVDKWTNEIATLSPVRPAWTAQPPITWACWGQL